MVRPKFLRSGNCFCYCIEKIKYGDIVNIVNGIKMDIQDGFIPIY